MGTILCGLFVAQRTYLESGEVDHAVNVRMRVKDLVEVVFFPDVDLKEFGPLAADELNAIDGFFGGVEQVVRDDDFVVCFK